MTKVNCLIADDEPIAREIIRNYCSQLAYLQVVGSCGNALEAKMILQQQKVDILFLDINMPVMDGITFLKTMKNAPQVIFTTAYKEYAIDAFDLAACDYLLKPFSLDRFIMAIDKAMEKLQPAPAATPLTAAMTIFSIWRIWRIMGLYFSRSEAPSEPFCSGVLPLRSWPAQNARPAPVIITQRASLSRSLSFRAWSTS